MAETAARTLFEDESLVIVDKPAGRLVIAGRGESAGEPLVAALSAARGRKLFVVHRLDRDTSGVLVFAKDAPTHKALSALFEGRLVHKVYLALVRGRLAAPVVLDLPLREYGSGRSGVKEGGKPSRTDVRPVEAFGDAATLVEAEPKTGRRHQVRVHLYAAGNPVLGDPLYGPADQRPLPAPRCMLHAARLAFSLNGRSVEAAAPLPPDFEALLAALRKRRD